MMMMMMMFTGVALFEHIAYDRVQDEFLSLLAEVWSLEWL